MVFVAYGMYSETASQHNTLSAYPSTAYKELWDVPRLFLSHSEKEAVNRIRDAEEKSQWEQPVTHSHLTPSLHSPHSHVAVEQRLDMG